MKSSFETAFKELNDEQRKAVEYIEGPLLVIAGPGTGKTQLLSLRVANILKKTDTDPSGVLCLTFTNNAATNMRERLHGFIGSDSRSINVQTFHSFASDIMSSYPEYFWRGASLTIAPDTVQLNIITEILSKLPLNNPLSMKFAGQYTAIKDVEQALKLTKEAGLNPEKLKAMIDANMLYLDEVEPVLIDIIPDRLSYKKLSELSEAIHELPDQPIDKNIVPLRSLAAVVKESLGKAIIADADTGKTANTGKWKKRWIQKIEGVPGMHDERKRNDWWLNFVEVYEMYRDHLHQAGYYDYSDMIVEVITQMEQHADLRSSVQEKYLYILIDEFQDTNAAQMRLAHLVATHHGNEESPNLMVVGDDDQTIYAFNGAELNNMLAFRRNYPPTQTIVLTKNYRSTQAVLDISEQIINQAEDRITNREQDLTKLLTAERNKSTGKIHHISYPTREHQFSEISDHIKELWGSDSTGSVAVLARNHDALIAISGLLNSKNVPIKYETQNNILLNDMVEQVCALAETLQAIGEGDKNTVNASLATALRHPMWDISPKILWELSINSYKGSDWLGHMLEHKETKLKDIAEWLMWLSGEASYQPLPVMIEHLLGLNETDNFKCPLRAYYLEMRDLDNTYLTALSACNRLLTLTYDFASTSKQVKLQDFVQLVKLHRDLDKPIVDMSWFINSDRAVELMTIHKSKGLEFDTVVLVDAIEKKWEPSNRGRKSPANLPLQSHGESYDDYVRLLYVATTRAKQSFIVSSYRFDGQGKQILTTPLLPTDIVSHEKADDELKPMVDVLEESIAWPRLDEKVEKELLRGRLENFQLSATGIYQFLDIVQDGPTSFFERSLLRIPEAGTVNLAYGNAMHDAMQAAQNLKYEGAYSLSKIHTAFEKSLAKQNISHQDFERHVEKGKEKLSQVLEEFKFEIPSNGKAEIPINQVRIGEAIIGGKIDHMLEDDKSILISDYKTGQTLNNLYTREKKSALKAWRYMLQLDFYTLLLAETYPKAKNKSVMTRIVQLDSESPKHLVLEHIPEEHDLERVRMLIKAIWKHIMELNFPDTSHYSQDLDGIQAFSKDLIHGDI